LLRIGSKRYDTCRNDVQVFSECEPVYAEFELRTPTNEARKWMRFPAKARTYLKAIAELTGAKLQLRHWGLRENRRFLCEAV